MKKLFYIIIFFLNFENLLALESKIIYRIDSEIITNIDIKNEFKYLSALNTKLQNLNEEQIFYISKESIIREKIKKIELLKNFKNLVLKKEDSIGIIRNLYLKLNLKSEDELKIYLKNFNLNIQDVEDKIKIDIFWNQLIMRKYESKLEINIEKIENEIKKNNVRELKTYLLSEIIFEIENKTELKNKIDLVKKSINKIGFENTTSTYSVAESAKMQGDIGWVSEQSLNKVIRKNLSFLNVGDISKPVVVPGGILILKIRDIKKENKKINVKLELQKAINYQRNVLLDQYSKIYFNKVKKNLEISE
tara:strand:+ start:526 stop:1443 length:918 start_codon:yes stop_codon:yes gene_type:complete